MSFWNNPEEKYYSPLQVLHFCIKYFINSFVDVAFNFFDSSFNSFSTNTCFVLFEVVFLFKLFSFLSKSAFLTKTVISFLLV